MVYIIKKLVPVYRQWEKIPKQYHNLKKAVYVTTFKFLYPNIPKILIEQYGLNPNEKIVVFWTKEISLPHFNRYRLKFRKVYSGSVEGFGELIKKRNRRRSNTRIDKKKEY
ncbi:MAG: hypothetical protein DRP84_12115 [Spirochaetes bacterium]|nr:MAG: hypothetical protein DRP84_12115 [Spirochaetota bacterium]